MRASILRVAFVAMAALLLTGAAFGQQTTYNYDRATDFTRFKTYKWVPIEGAQHPDQTTAGTITAIVDELLAGKGFVKADADPVDLLVGYGTTTQDQQLISGYGAGVGFRFGGGMGMAETSTIKNGTIMIDVYNAAGKLLVWRGTVTDTLNPGSKPDKKHKKLKSALTKVLENLPPPKAK